MQLGSNMMTKESQYLLIKQKLDSYNISTTFPLEVMPLLHSLITRLDHESTKSKPSTSLATNPKLPVFQSHPSSQIQPALRHQLNRTLSLNNNLHMQLITQKQQIQSLKHCIDKLALESADSSQRDEVKHVIGMCREKERELVQELQVVKFKYNELVDFVMGEDQLEKMYIKKLINHRKYEGVGQQNEKQTNEHRNKHTKNNNNNNQSAQDLNSRITFKAGSSRKQSRQRINKTIDSKQNYHPQEPPSSRTNQNLQSSSHHHDHRLHLLKDKLANRQKQIQRLQSVIRHDGPNLTKAMTQFAHQMQQQHYEKLQQRIKLLEEQNHEVKQQLQKNKLNGGRYQALVEEVERSHELINELKKENAMVKRQRREKQFDLAKEKKEWSRNVVAAEVIKEELKGIKQSDQFIIDELKRKVEFYEREMKLKVGEAEIQRENNQKSNKIKKVSKRSVKTPKSYPSKLKQPQQTKYEPSPLIQQKPANQSQAKRPQQRQKYQNHISLSTSNKKQESTSKATKQKQPKKPAKKLPISQIIQEEEQDESYIKPQPTRNEDQNDVVKASQQGDNNYGQRYNHAQKEQPQGEEEDRVNDGQQEDDSSEHQQADERNDTMIQQYEQTINELSAKCMQLKEELTSKNQTIKGLEEIANRLMGNNHSLLLQSDSNNSGKQAQSTTHLTHLTHQLQTLSSLLNESQFTKQQLRRQLIRVQNLYNQLKATNTQNHHHPSSQPNDLQQQITHLKQLLEQKDAKITDMRQDNTTIQDQLLKALDRIRRLNDEIDAVRKENDVMKSDNQKILHQLGLNQTRLEQAALLLKHQRERNSNTLELSEVEKDEIIVLRKALIKAEERIKEMQEELQALRQQNKRLVSQLM